MKKLITAEEIRSIAGKGGGEVHIGKDQLITPGARDLAVELGLKVIYGQPPGDVSPYVPVPESLRAAGNLPVSGRAQSPGCPPALAAGDDPGLVDRVTRIVMERTAGKAGDQPGGEPVAESGDILGEELVRSVVSAVINRLATGDGHHG